MDYHQKQIQKQTGVSQSLYIYNITSINNNTNNRNEGKKHDSYQRYLLKKKGIVFSKQGNIIETPPDYGNKTTSLNISSKVNDNCDFCLENE